MSVGEAFTIPFSAQGTAPQAVQAARDADPAQVGAALKAYVEARAAQAMG